MSTIAKQLLIDYYSIQFSKHIFILTPKAQVIMKRNRKSLLFISTFLLALVLGRWINTKGRTFRHIFTCRQDRYLVRENLERPGTLEHEVERNSALLLVGVLVNTKEDEKNADIIYSDFHPETNIKLALFTTKRTISLHSRQVAYLECVNTTEPNNVAYLRMLVHVSQQYGNKFNWFLFTESNYFVNIDKLTFLKKLQYSNEFVFLPQVPRKSGVNDYGHELNRAELLDSLAQRVEYQKSNMDIVHVIQPGMILSRPLLQKISSLTESCMNQGRVLPQCLQKSFSISWIHDFEVAISDCFDLIILNDPRIYMYHTQM